MHAHYTAPQREAIGRVVREMRKRKRLTQAQLAEAAGITPTFICKVELGIASLGADGVSRLASALGVSAAELEAGAPQAIAHAAPAASVAPLRLPRDRAVADSSTPYVSRRELAAAARLATDAECAPAIDLLANKLTLPRHTVVARLLTPTPEE